ncbi:ORF7 [Ranid herpesvirus 2]|uniref:ORF7 n=1 Tax=Ranid herpesvirus 2 TaxID=389214 RepID=Q14W99_9VIRU|nr:ORF7 [Ranid herpesvirus 2]ABG25564.1 ORF7 [Ranid herpesvirus 2]
MENRINDVATTSLLCYIAQSESYSPTILPYVPTILAHAEPETILKAGESLHMPVEAATVYEILLHAVLQPKYTQYAFLARLVQLDEELCGALCSAFNEEGKEEFCVNFLVRLQTKDNRPLYLKNLFHIMLRKYATDTEALVAYVLLLTATQKIDAGKYMCCLCEYERNSVEDVCCRIHASVDSTQKLAECYDMLKNVLWYILERTKVARLGVQEAQAFYEGYLVHTGKSILKEGIMKKFPPVPFGITMENFLDVKKFNENKPPK